MLNGIREILIFPLKTSEYCHPRTATPAVAGHSSIFLTGNVLCLAKLIQFVIPVNSPLSSPNSNNIVIPACFLAGISFLSSSTLYPIILKYKSLLEHKNL